MLYSSPCGVCHIWRCRCEYASHKSLHTEPRTRTDSHQAEPGAPVTQRPHQMFPVSQVFHLNPDNSQQMASSPNPLRETYQVTCYFPFSSTDFCLSYLHPLPSFFPSSWGSAPLQWHSPLSYCPRCPQPSLEACRVQRRAPHFRTASVLNLEFDF